MSLSRCAVVAVICSACPFAGNHTGPHRINRGANRLVQRALRRCLCPREDLAAGTPLGILHLRDLYLKDFLGIEGGIFFFNAIAALGDDTDTPPSSIRDIKYVLHHSLCLWISYSGYGPRIGIRQLRMAGFELLDEKRNRLEDIGRFESGHNARDRIAVEKRPIGFETDDHRNMTRQDEPVNWDGFGLHQGRQGRRDPFVR